VKNVLIVSPYYPPGPTACVHRARLLAKHLPSVGWRPVVLCVDQSFLEESLDHGLVALTSSDAEVVKCKAIPARMFRPLGLGEVTLRAFLPMRVSLDRLLRDRPFDVVLFTGSHFYSMLHAPAVKGRFGVPVVLDFQDPWVSAWGGTQPIYSKEGLTHQLALWLEPRVVKTADFITAVSDKQNEQMAARYPWLDRHRMAAIPIGGDPQDYDALRTMPVADRSFALEPDCFHLSYVGTIWPPVVETVRTLFRAVALFRSRAPELYARLRLNFIGTTANPNDNSAYQALPLARAEGVGDVVREVPQRLPYLEALSIQANSDAILILGSDEPHYTASKIFGVLMSGRPYLSVFHEASEAHALLTRAGGGLALGFACKAGLPALTPKLTDAIARLVRRTPAIGAPRREVYAPFEASAIAARYGAIFERLGKHQPESERILKVH
jgi:hypothetical protein